MPKITHIFKTYFPETAGGLEEAIRQYGRYAVGKGFDVEVVSVGPKAQCLATPDGITTRFFPVTFDVFSNPFSFSLARSFKKICRNTDLIHLHFPWPTAELLSLCHRVEKPVMLTFHCDIHKLKMLRAMYLPFVGRYLRQVDRIFVTSRALARSTPCLAPFGYKTDEIHLFLNEARFACLPGPDAACMEFTRKIKKFALFAGVLRWYKGLDVLLDTARLTQTHIVIVGKGEKYHALESRIRKENLKNVHLLGFQEDRNLKFLIESADQIVLPSITPAEAFGQILLEGLYFSKPLVSTELGTGTSIVNKNGYTGLVVKPGCSHSLASAINRISCDKALRARFSKNAFGHYLAHFTAKAQGEKYIRVCQDLLRGEPGQTRTRAL